MMPGMPKELKDAKIEDDDLKPIEAIITSMTPEERTFPNIIKAHGVPASLPARAPRWLTSIGW